MTATNRLVGLVSGILVLALLPVSQAQAAPTGTSSAPLSSAPSGLAGRGLTGFTATPTFVNVSQLPPAASTTAQPPVALSPRRFSRPAAYAAAKSTAAGRQGVQIGLPSVTNVDSTFIGIDSFSEAPVQGGSVEPPDTQLAVGTTQIVEIVNQTGQVYDKGTQAKIGANFSLQSFFKMASVDANYFASDPRILFDSSVDRWYATMLGFNLSTNDSAVFLAVSRTSDPTGLWADYVLYHGLGANAKNGSNLLCDQPKLGYSTVEFNIACTTFDNQNPSMFYGGVLLVASKAQGLAGMSMASFRAGPYGDVFGVVPAQNLTANSSSYMVENLNNGPLRTAAARVWLSTGDPAGGLPALSLTSGNVAMGATSLPPQAEQRGSATVIDTGDDRFMSAVLFNGDVWTSATEGCTPGGDSAVCSCMRVLRFTASSLAVVQNSTAGITGRHIYYPTLSVADTGNAAIVYSKSSSTDYPGVFATQQLSASPGVFFGGGPIEVGTQPYAGSRWGDYSGAATDLHGSNVIWVAGEWSTNTGPFSASWSTGIGRLATWAAASVPDAPTAVNATAGNGFAVLDWTEPVNDGGAPITNHRVTPYVLGVAQTPIATGSALPSYTVSPLANGTTYTFTVAATNSVGTGAPSAMSNAVTPNANAPGQTTGVSATAGIGSAILTWTAPVGGMPPTSYRVAASTGPVISVTGAPPVTQAVMPGLTTAAVTFTVTATNGSGTGPPSPASNSVTPLPGGTYNPLIPARLLDTRFAIGVPARPAGPLGAGQSLDLQVTGQGGVPTPGVSSAVLNVTITAPTNASFLSVWPQGSVRPFVSNLNWIPGKTVANLVEVAVGPTGRVSFFNPSGNVDVIVDVQGYVGDNTDSYTRAGLFNPLPPKRDLDTRVGVGAPTAKLGPGATLNLVVTNLNGVPAAGVSAVVLNVTAVVPSQAGFLTVWPAGATRPTASNLNFVPNQVVPNRVLVKVGTAGQVSIYNPTGTVDVVADVNGWFTDAASAAGGSAFIGVLPTRIFDTRNTRGPIGPGGKLQLGPTTPYATPHSALVLNVTAVTPTSDGFLTLYPDNPADPNHTPPNASDLNFISGDVVPNLVVVGLGPAPASIFDTYNPTGSTQVVYDLDGYYGAIVAAPPP